jgi:two-component system, response regulator
MITAINQKYVLLVEDNPDDVALTQMAFKRNRIANRLAVASDGEEALDYLFCRGKYAGRNLNDKPAVILLDLKLPFISGLEVLRQIRADKSTSSIPVVVLTSSLEDSDQSESQRLGANAYFGKPVEFDLFLKIIQQITTEWLE